MRSVIYAVVTTLLVIFIAKVFIVDAYAQSRKEEEKGYSFKNVKYLSTYDGDTVFVDIPSLHPVFGKRLGIRVRYIDTPEIRSSNKYEKMLGNKAKEFTKEKMEGAKQLLLTECVRGKYARLVCKVSNSKTNDLGADLIKNDLASPYED